MDEGIRLLVSRRIAFEGRLVGIDWLIRVVAFAAAAKLRISYPTRTNLGAKDGDRVNENGSKL
jgi:hypothetical protein